MIENTEITTSGTSAKGALGIAIGRSGDAMKSHGSAPVSDSDAPTGDGGTNIWITDLSSTPSPDQTAAEEPGTAFNPVAEKSPDLSSRSGLPVIHVLVG
jgi:hypothetical protein